MSDILFGVWLIAIETPKYNDKQYVPYDAIWFEGLATSSGEKFMKEYFPEES